MIKTFAVNENNDIYLDIQGNLAIATGIDAVVQGCKQVARTLLGEVLFDTTLGIPYFEQVWNGTPNIQQFNVALRNAFLSVPDVVEVVSLMINQTGNTLTYNAIIRTIYGSGVVNG